MDPSPELLRAAGEDGVQHRVHIDVLLRRAAADREAEPENNMKST